MVINSENKIAVGRVVRLKSGGPLMTVDSVEIDKNGDAMSR